MTKAHFRLRLKLRSPDFLHFAAIISPHLCHLIHARKKRKSAAIPSKIYDSLILGADPAGLSAEIALARVKRTALVLSHQTFRNDVIKAMHAVLGYDGAHPADFRGIAREQIEKYGDGIDLAEGEAFKVRKADFEDGYRVLRLKRRLARCEYGGRWY